MAGLFVYIVIYQVLDIFKLTVSVFIKHCIIRTYKVGGSGLNCLDSLDL